MPKVSVIIPTLNRKDELKECLNSLINQNFSDFEIIVVDDGSKDGTGQMVKEFKSKSRIPIRYFYQEKMGPAKARNRGIAAAKGKIIAFTDDDCRPQMDWIKSIVNSMRGVEGVEGRTAPPNSSRLTPFSHTIVNETGGEFPTCNIAYTREVLREIGGFCDKFGTPFREDSDLAFSVIKKGYKIKFEKRVYVEHPVYTKDLKGFLSEKRKFEMDPLLYKRHPKLYKRYIRFPFEMFTPFYILFTLLCIAGLLLSPWLVLVALLGLIFTGGAELLKRSWRATMSQFFMFLGGQIAGSFIIYYSVLKGCWEFRVNPLKLLWVR